MFATVKGSERVDRCWSKVHCLTWLHLDTTRLQPDISYGPSKQQVVYQPRFAHPNRAAYHSFHRLAVLLCLELAAQWPKTRFIKHFHVIQSHVHAILLGCF